MIDRVKLLEESLADIARALDSAESGTEIAALLREKRITLAELASLAGVEKGSSVDELQKRRQKRRAKAGLVEGSG